MAIKLPRGIRNNNPGNIRISGIPWLGKIKDKNTDGIFEQFDTADHGIEALANNLLSYQLIHKLDTVEKIIHRWAPSMENDTFAYIRAVIHDAGLVGVTATTKIDLRNPMILYALTIAIIKHENGQVPYQSERIISAVKAAIKKRGEK